MKMNGLHYMGFAAALLGGTMLCSCSSDEPDAAVNPTYNGETVKTTFAISVPTGQAATRQTENVVQSAGNFRGINDLYIMPYVTDPTNLTSSIYLGGISTTGDFTKQYTTGTDKGGYKLYSNVEIPVGTENFLVYAKATPETGDDVNGKLTFNHPTNSATLSSNNISFALNKITDGSVADDFQEDVVAYLNSIRNAKIGETGSEVYWKNFTEAQNFKLYQLFKYFTELKASSAVAVCKVLNDLYSEAGQVIEVPEGTDPETEATLMAKAIQAAIANVANTDADPYFSWSAPTLSVKSGKDYPEALGLPQGCLTLTYADGAGFAAGDRFSVEESLVVNPSIQFANICYPAELYYYQNTPVKATPSAQVQSTDWPTTLAGWNAGFTDWADVVEATSNTIALAKNIQYGVAQLEARVRCVEQTQLDDNYAAYVEAHKGDATIIVRDQKITIPDGGFIVKGILIGGQPSALDYQMLPSSNDDSYVIYDTQVNGVKAVKASSCEGLNAIYTLVLDNKVVSGNEKNVTIALELENNSGVNIYGVNGIVAPGQRFYLLGSMTIGNQTNNDNLDEDGDGDPDVTRVFQKDHVTKANITINSLKSAYATIPDLTSSKLQLGLSIDLLWMEGMSFDIDIQ